MATNYNPRIITDGLVLALDAGNTKSYVGIGSTWIDRSGLGNTGTLTNGPTYSSANGGSIVFDGISGTGGDFILLSNMIIQSGDFSCEVWFNQTSTTPSAVANQRCLIGGSNNTTGADNCQFLIGDDGSIALALNNAAVTLSPSTTGLISLNTWNQIIWTRSGTGITAYLNGVSRCTGTSSAAVRVDRIAQVGSTGGFAKNLPGNISNVKIYSKALTAAEVSQNFNALRGRFGI